MFSAYVSGEKAGLILENPYRMGETLDGGGGLDIEAEKKVVEERLGELHTKEATDAEITMDMKDFGIQRFDISNLLQFFFRRSGLLGQLVCAHIN